jgi:hypothetical protein
MSEEIAMTENTTTNDQAMGNPDQPVLVAIDFSDDARSALS